MGSVEVVVHEGEDEGLRRRREPSSTRRGRMGNCCIRRVSPWQLMSVEVVGRNEVYWD
jgi:hypothetical protein